MATDRTDTTPQTDQQRAQGRWNYPHMCRDEHIEIGHRDSEYERCPLCRALAKIETLEQALRKITNNSETCGDDCDCGLIALAALGVSHV